MEEQTPSRFHVDEILRSQLESAKERYRLALDNFVETRRSISSGIPSTDGVLRVRLAGKERLSALAALQESLSRFNGWIVRGVVPSELLERPCVTVRAATQI
jgi:hypothetical protein